MNHILVVEDYQAHLEAYLEIIRTTEMVVRKGVNVIPCEGGEAAMEVLQEGTPICAAVMDSLRDASGTSHEADALALMRHLRRRIATMPLLLVSGQSRPSGYDLTNPFNYYLGKPVDIREFRHIVGEMLQLVYGGV